MVEQQTRGAEHGGAYEASGDTLTASVTLADGRTLGFAGGSIGCMIDDRMRSMYCESIHRNGGLLVSAEWFARAVLNWNVTSCNGVVYVTDHWAELSYYLADVIKSILRNEYDYPDYERRMRGAIPFLK